jgi:branched-chain amino acid transport system ATP-binding protein
LEYQIDKKTPVTVQMKTFPDSKRKGYSNESAKRMADDMLTGQAIFIRVTTMIDKELVLPLWVASHLDRKARLDFVYEVIGELTEMRHRKALLLSGGQQKLVALGRALGIGTRCLLLDEPFEGIAPALSERLSEVLASLKGKDLTLLMSQSDMNHSRGLIDVEFTIERGANLASG